MMRSGRPQHYVRRTERKFYLEKSLNDQIPKAAKRAGFKSTSQFIASAIERVMHEVESD